MPCAPPANVSPPPKGLRTHSGPVSDPGFGCPWLSVSEATLLMSAVSPNKQIENNSREKKKTLFAVIGWGDGDDDNNIQQSKPWLPPRQRYSPWSHLLPG